MGHQRHHDFVTVPESVLLLLSSHTKLGNIFSRHSVFFHSDSDASVTTAQICSFPSQQFGSKKHLDFVHNIVYIYKKLECPGQN